LFVISPDTSIIHFASAMRRPVLAIYAPMNASQEWLPHSLFYDAVWAQDHQPVREIDPQLIIEGAERMLVRLSSMNASSSPESK
jgi:ADP-heptose:LPS heptosyltransferase